MQSVVNLNNNGSRATGRRLVAFEQGYWLFLCSIPCSIAEIKMFILDTKEKSFLIVTAEMHPGHSYGRYSFMIYMQCNFYELRNECLKNFPETHSNHPLHISITTRKLFPAVINEK